jgi:hypothetical protein
MTMAKAKTARALAGTPTRSTAANSAGAPAQAPAWQRLGEHWRRLARGELLIPALLLFLLSQPLFARLVSAPDPGVPLSDHLYHVGLAAQLARENIAPRHPLFHYCVILLSFGDNPKVMFGIASIVLALALAARAYLTAVLFTQGNTPSLVAICGLCLVLALVMPLPNWWVNPLSLVPRESAIFRTDMPSPGWWQLPSVYWGQVSPNVWHNPTGIMAMPFCLLLFLGGYRALETLRPAMLVAAGGVMVLTTLAKPIYVLAFAPCFGIAALAGYVRSLRAGQLTIRDVIQGLAAAFGPVAVVLLIQYRRTFGEGRLEEIRVVFAPLAAWSQLTPVQYIPFAILLGIVFPLAVATLYRREVFRDGKLMLAWAVFAVAIAQYALLAETGPRAEHNHFGWGAILADQVLFVTCCDFLLRQPASNSRHAAFVVLGLHVLSGIIYLARCLFVPSLANVF